MFPPDRWVLGLSPKKWRVGLREPLWRAGLSSLLPCFAKAEPHFPTAPSETGVSYVNGDIHKSHGDMLSRDAPSSR